MDGTIVRPRSGVTHPDHHRAAYRGETHSAPRPPEGKHHAAPCPTHAPDGCGGGRRGRRHHAHHTRPGLGRQPAGPVHPPPRLTGWLRLAPAVGPQQGRRGIDPHRRRVRRQHHPGGPCLPAPSGAGRRRHRRGGHQAPAGRPAGPHLPGPHRRQRPRPAAAGRPHRGGAARHHHPPGLLRHPRQAAAEAPARAPLGAAAPHDARGGGRGAHLPEAPRAGGGRPRGPGHLARPGLQRRGLPPGRLAAAAAPGAAGRAGPPASRR